MDNPTEKTIQTIDQIKTKVIDFLTDYGFQIVGALIILVIGVMIAWWLGRALKNWLEKKNVEPPLCMLATRLVRLLVFGLTLVVALDKCGVPIAPMIAGISVAGVGIGLAMQGVLGNLVAGLTIIFTKPFRVGEYIEIAGVEGQVKTIELFCTTLLHPDQSRVVVPNRKIVGEILHNYGQIRQLDMSVGVAIRHQSQSGNDRRARRPRPERARAEGTRAPCRRHDAGGFNHQHRHQTVDQG